MDAVKKDCILQAATRAFSRWGFRKASVDEIAKDAGVAKGTVYLACESKEDLFYQSLHRELREYIADCAKGIDPRQPADQLLEQLVRASLVYLQSRPLVRDLFLGDVQQALPEWRERFMELRALGRANVEELLRLGIKQGRFRKELDVENVALLLQDLHLAAHLFHGHELESEPARLEDRLRAGLDLVLNGIRSAAARPA
jgi:AcrR family transcriptional regulator